MKLFLALTVLFCLCFIRNTNEICAQDSQIIRYGNSMMVFNGIFTGTMGQITSSCSSIYYQENSFRLCDELEYNIITTDFLISGLFLTYSSQNGRDIKGINFDSSGDFYDDDSYNYVSLNDDQFDTVRGLCCAGNLPRHTGQGD
eukprot:TRINITY_DN105_c0_g1_i1.p1 TRINITY_DN105_c0_g1~~TRINITY_DN105_c0_g1_i1.p1  ORF type:complete len:156 (-),score=32.84 TRINITY_DN105_c0_g1_i1:94-525(-)